MSVLWLTWLYREEWGCVSHGNLLDELVVGSTVEIDKDEAKYFISG